jgi:NodT family efflux transporter outer membrane factor (OMF) lipoprotein
MSKVSVRIALLLGLTALSACQSAVLSDYDSEITTRDAEVPQDWQIASRTAIEPQSWRTLFDDPLLADYLDQAETLNLDLQQAEARMRQAEASLRQSRTLLGPTVSANFSLSGFSDLAESSNPRDAGSASVNASWDPDLFGINRATVRQANSRFDLQRANTERLRRIILSQTARAYFQIIEADLQIELAQENLSFLDETKRVSKARFEAGDIARSDLALAELEFENAVAGLRNQEFAARSARRALSILIGGFGSDGLTVADRMPSAREIGIHPVPADLLSARYDILAARAAISIELEGLTIAQRANWPGLQLSGRVGSSGAEISDLFDPDFYVASLTTSVAATLFDSGRNRGEIDAAKARLDTAIAAYAQTIRTAVVDVNDAFDQYATSVAALEALERARISAEEALALEQIKLDLGETILLDVLTVQRRVNAVRGARISTERRLLDAQVSAYLSLGSR